MRHKRKRQDKFRYVKIENFWISRKRPCSKLKGPVMEGSTIVSVFFKSPILYGVIYRNRCIKTRTYIFPMFASFESSDLIGISCHFRWCTRSLPCHSYHIFLWRKVLLLIALSPPVFCFTCCGFWVLFTKPLPHFSHKYVVLRLFIQLCNFMFSNCYLIHMDFFSVYDVR